MIHNRDPAETEPTQAAIYLSEYILDINEGSDFLSGISKDDQKRLRHMGTRCTFDKGQSIFHQGDSHTGIWIIESGRARTYYVGPTGREITLAYWTPGHFIGGPEVFGEAAMCGPPTRWNLAKWYFSLDPVWKNLFAKCLRSPWL